MFSISPQQIKSFLSKLNVFYSLGSTNNIDNRLGRLHVSIYNCSTFRDKITLYFYHPCSTMLVRPCLVNNGGSPDRPETNTFIIHPSNIFKMLAQTVFNHAIIMYWLFECCLNFLTFIFFNGIHLKVIDFLEVVKSAKTICCFSDSF